MRDGWFSASLGDLLKIVPGKYVAKTDYVEDGEFWIYGSNSIMGKLDRFLVDKAHVVMAAIGAYAGSVRYSAEPSWINNNAMALVPNEKVLVKYLHFWLESHLDLARVVVGTGQPYVQRPLLLKEVVQLPALPEQKRIVDLISTVDSYVEALREQLESAKRSRSAVLHELLTAGGDGWTEATLGEVAEWWSGGTPKAREPKYYDDGSIPWAVIADMHRGVIDATNTSITKDALEVIGGRLAPVGSVLISMYASVGKSAIARVPLATNQAIAWSIPNESKIVPFFLFLVSQRLEKEIADSARGATQRNINRKMLREFVFQLPPLHEQERIVDLVSTVDSYIEAIERQIASTMSLRSGLLSDLLSGDHEIPASYDQLIGAA